eukprot:jgi/Botrbrau1/18474/Bobra.0072s0056.1
MSWLPCQEPFKNGPRLLLVVIKLMLERITLRMVLKRCATMTVVRSHIKRWRACWTSASEVASRALVASSNRRMRGCFKMARAIATRCF